MKANSSRPESTPQPRKTNSLEFSEKAKLAFSFQGLAYLSLDVGRRVLNLLRCSDTSGWTEKRIA